MNDDAGLRPQLGARNAPAPCRVVQQHAAHLGAGDSHGAIVAPHGEAGIDPHALAPAPADVAIGLGIRGRHFQRHLVPIGIHLLGEHDGNAGHRALAHLGGGGDDGDAVIGRDPDPDADRARRFARRRLRHQRQTVGAERDGEADTGGPAEESAAGDPGCRRDGFRHGPAPLDARWMAAMIRV